MSNPDHKDTPPPSEPPVPPISPRDKRIVKHVKAMAEAGTDIKKFIGALHAFRDDASLTTAQREAIFLTMAQDAAHAYFIMVTGKAPDWENMIPKE